MRRKITIGALGTVGDDSARGCVAAIRLHLRLRLLLLRRLPEGAALAKGVVALRTEGAGRGGRGLGAAVPVCSGRVAGRPLRLQQLRGR